MGVYPLKIGVIDARLSKVNDIFVLKKPTNNAKVHKRDFVCFVSFAGKLTNFQQNQGI
jgi:hypothetical protein